GVGGDGRPTSGRPTSPCPRGRLDPRPRGRAGPRAGLRIVLARSSPCGPPCPGPTVEAGTCPAMATLALASAHRRTVGTESGRGTFGTPPRPRTAGDRSACHLRPLRPTRERVLPGLRSRGELDVLGAELPNVDGVLRPRGAIRPQRGP